MRYRTHINRSAMRRIPIQNRPHRARNVLALTDTDHPETGDLGRFQARVPNLIWWLDDSVVQERVMLFAGDGVEEWLEFVELRQFKEMFSDGQVWYVRVRRNGKLDRARWRYKEYQLLGYSKDQYALMRWALWKMREGWTADEAYGLIDPFWTVHKGQSPLNVNNLRGWWSWSSSMASKGYHWP